MRSAMDNPAGQPPVHSSAPKGTGQLHGTSQTKWLRLGLALAFLVLLTVGVILWSVRAGGPTAAPAQKEPSLPSQGLASDFELTDQNGQRVRLSDFRGRVVLMTFFYASCPGFCSLMNFNLKQVHDALDEESRQRVVLLSVTFDPLVDVPERLMEYAEAHGFSLPNWYFLTGSPKEIEGVTRAYGIPVEKTEPQVHIHPDGTGHVHEGDFSHLAQALLIDQKGEVRKAYLGVPVGEEVFSPELIAGDVRRLLVSTT